MLVTEWQQAAYYMIIVNKLTEWQPIIYIIDNLATRSVYLLSILEHPLEQFGACGDVCRLLLYGMLDGWDAAPGIFILSLSIPCSSRYYSVSAEHRDVTALNYLLGCCLLSAAVNFGESFLLRPSLSRIMATRDSG